MFLSILLALPLACGAELTVAAASDLVPLHAPLTEAFAKLTGHRLRFVSGSSGTLARQIANGAPYDVFLSANRAFVEELAASGDVDGGTIALYAKGRLGIWSAKSRSPGLEQLRESQVRHIAIANPQHAPYGLAARQALEKAGLWQELEPKIVFGENVRQALQYAESGNADVAIVSWTLIAGRGTLLAESLHEPIWQAGGVVKRSRYPAEGKRLLGFLLSKAGQALLAGHGLGAVR